MRTPSGLYQTTPTIYECEFKECPQCEQELVEMSYLNGLKTIVDKENWTRKRAKIRW